MEQTKIVVTGRVGSGKSTLLRGLALFAEDLGVSYFAVFTPEVREGKRRAGFALENDNFNHQQAGITGSTGFTGTPEPAGGQPAKLKRTMPFARLHHLIDNESVPLKNRNRVGRYTIDLDIVRDMIVIPLRAIMHAGKNTLIFLDEVSPMHLKYAPFLATLRELLDSPFLSFITLAEGTDPAIKEEIRNHPKVEMFALTRDNRDALLNTLIAQLVDQAARE